MALSKLVLEDFQRHERKVVKLSPAITTLVGESDAGKSAIVRALRRLCLARPSGGKQARRGSKGLKIKAVVDGHKVALAHGEGGNYYLLDGRKFSAVGAGKVPEPVASLLAVDESNFQRQHEAHFWFSLTPGQAARELNQLASLGQIDDLTADLASQARAAKADMGASQRRLGAAEADEGKLAWVEAAAAELDDLRRLEAAAAAMSSRIAELEALARGGETAGLRARDANGAVLCGLAAVLAAEKSMEAAAEADSLKRLIKRLARAESAEPPPDIAPLEKLAAELDGLKQRQYFLQDCVIDLEYQEAGLDQLTELVQRKERYLEEAMKGKCPVCRQTIPSSRSAPRTSTFR